MNLYLIRWMMPCIVLRLTSNARHSMDKLTFGAGHWCDRSTRQAVQLLSPGILDDGSLFEQPVLPTPTDLPVLEPFDVPVPEPMDVPPPDPRDIPPPQPTQPHFDPKPRSVP